MDAWGGPAVQELRTPDPHTVSFTYDHSPMAQMTMFDYHNI